MAGTVVTTETTHRHVKKVKFTWTSASGGDATAATTNYFTGKIVYLATVPDAVAAPTTAYDVTVTDEDGIDVLAGAGADRSATATEIVLSASLGAVVESKLNLAVAAAGNAKQGVVIVHIQ